MKNKASKIIVMSLLSVALSLIVIFSLYTTASAKIAESINNSKNLIKLTNVSKNKFLVPLNVVSKPKTSPTLTKSVKNQKLGFFTNLYNFFSRIIFPTFATVLDAFGIGDTTTTDTSLIDLTATSSPIAGEITTETQATTTDLSTSTESTSTEVSTSTYAVTPEATTSTSTEASTTQELVAPQSTSTDSGTHTAIDTPISSSTDSISNITDATSTVYVIDTTS